MTAPYAEVIGDPIAQSKSPLIHGFWLEKLGLSGEFGRSQVRQRELDYYLSIRRRDPRWRGCSVTLPHKIAIFDHLDARHESAELVGAVNAVVRSGDALIGHNTDASGFAEPLLRRPHWRAREAERLATYVQVIGAGGAARAAVAGAMMAGYSCFELFNRTVERAHDLAFQFGLQNSYAGPLEAIAPLEEGSGSYGHIVVNATSMGMGGSTSPPVDLSAYPKDTIVYDMVYSPLETPLLVRASALGLRTINGLEMLVGQAAVAFELFFGQPAPRQHDAALRELLLQ